MVRNRIKVLRAEAEISATALADKMPEGVDKIVMSYIEKGRVLPTREGLETMCDVFDCLPTDIYDAQDIDLLAVKREPEQQQPAPEPVKVKAVSNGKNPNEIIIRPARRSVEQHEGMEQIRVWMPAEERRRSSRRWPDLATTALPNGSARSTERRCALTSRSSSKTRRSMKLSLLPP
jgi:DNA-binding XRE family transcriptional regulator